LRCREGSDSGDLIAGEGLPLPDLTTSVKLHQGWPTLAKLTLRRPLPATGATKEAAPSDGFSSRPPDLLRSGGFSSACFVDDDAHRRQGSKAPKTASLFGLTQGRRGRESDEG
jgi:hypothetical protein